MKKILEVILDDDGKMKFDSEYSLGVTMRDLAKDPTLSSKKNLKKMDDAIKAAIDGLVDCWWKDGNDQIYPIIRLLSMAEMMSTSQPYEQAEAFWSQMMFSFIPHNEKYASKLKAKYGIKEENVTKPFRWVNPAFADLMCMEIPSEQVDDQGIGGRLFSISGSAKLS